MARRTGGFPDRKDGQGFHGTAYLRPLVKTHPETGRKSLFVNRLFTTRLQQLLPGESRALLAHLYDWCERPEFTCRWS